jgi:hypothetical protein
MGFVVSKSNGDKADSTKIIENQPFLRQGANRFPKFSSLGYSAGKLAFVVSSYRTLTPGCYPIFLIIDYNVGWSANFAPELF